MAQKTLATIGLTVLATAIFVSWGANRWVQTRTFDPVDMPISLEAGQIRSGEFEINLRETYWVSIHIDDSLDDYYNDDRCSFRNLGSKRLRVFRMNPRSATGRELWARSYDLDEGQGADGFRGIPGKYEVEWDVPARRSLPQRAPPAPPRFCFFRRLSEVWRLTSVSVSLSRGDWRNARAAWAVVVAAGVRAKTAAANVS